MQEAAVAPEHATALCLDTIVAPASLALHYFCDRVPTLCSRVLHPDDGAWLENRQGPWRAGRVAPWL